MISPTIPSPSWAVYTIWGVVNAVNLLQALGFISRVLTGEMTINHQLGYVMIALAIPAGAAMIAFLRAGAAPLQWLGPLVYIVFIVLMLVVEDILSVEFRSPARPEILVPYLVLFFGSIFLMGLPMYRIDRRLWLVTVATTIILLGSMIWAMRKGVA